LGASKLTDLKQTIAELEQRLQASLAERDELLQQQAATNEVLQVINASSGDLAPVFDAILERAMRLCEAEFGLLATYGGGQIRTVAARGVPPAFAEFRKNNPPDYGPGTGPARILAGERVVHIVDLKSGDAYRAGDPNRRAVVDLGGARTVLLVPLPKNEFVLGYITIYRKEVRPYSDKQIFILQNFADQAAIAIENARLFNETKEALERQAATADILRVISDSPADVQPVFQAIAEHARLLCKAQVGATTRLEGDTVHLAGVRSMSADAEEAMRSSFPMPLKLASPNIRRAIIEQVPIQVPDVHLDSDYAHLVDGTQRMGFRSIMSVPLMHEGRSIGTIGVAREEPGLFPVAAVSLLQTFADQAVIAIENVRLFEEVQARTEDLRESLQQQTATADVLKVISRSAFDLQTVLQTLVESAARLCNADKATITREKDGQFYRAEIFGYSDEFLDYVRDVPVLPERGSCLGRALLEGVAVHIPDVHLDPEYTFSEGQRLGGFRTMLGVPMLREGIPIGVVALTRSEPRPFTDKQIELVTTFADQAAIAIENVRLFENVEARTRELAKSLEDLRTAQDRLVQTEKLASLGQLTAGIAHEIKNPLNFVNNFSALSAELTDELNDVLKPAPLSDKMRKEVDELTELLKDNLEKVVQHGKRADSIVKNMLLHSREGAGEQRPADINALLDESLNLAYHGARAEKSEFNITLQRDFDSSAGTIELFPQEVTRAFLNLISNGFYAATKRKSENGNGNFEPILYATTKNLGDSVEIRIRDNGTGIPPEVKEKMFNPFFTTKPAGEGTGLGLSMSHDIIVKQHGGRIDVETEPGQFTEFKIVLPRVGNRSKKI
jgi:two-component system, NtrC family, sensor kinase